jgi:hypothetical protein
MSAMMNCFINDEQLKTEENGTRYVDASALGWRPGCWCNIIETSDGKYRWVMSVVMSGDLWGWRYDKYADGAFVVPSETIIVVND